MNIGIGFSNDSDGNTAAKDAAFEAKTNLRQDRIDMALIFSTVHYNPHETLPIIQKLLNKAKIIGCSTAGIILSKSVETRGIGVLTIQSDDIKFGIGSAEDIHLKDGRQIGKALAQNCLNDYGKHSRQLFIFFVDSRLQNTSLLLKSLQEILGNVFPMAGAGSCDDFRFADNFQIFQNNVLTNSAVGLILGGRVNIGIGAQHGWRPLGKPRKIDKVDRNIIKTIDGKKAYSLYEKFFEKEADTLRSTNYGRVSILYPLGIYIEETSGYLLRNVIDILPDGSIVCQGDIPEGAQVHLMIGNKESCVRSAEEAAKEAYKNLLGKNPKFIIVLESMARLKLGGRTAFQEIEKIKDVFGPKVPIIGMYSHGEISPLHSNKRFKTSHLQNESIVIMAIL